MYKIYRMWWRTDSLPFKYLQQYQVFYIYQYLLIYFSSFVHPPKGLNTTFYTNPEYDQTVGAARQVMDTAKRKALYKKAATMLWDDAAAIWLHVEPYAIAYQSNYQGLDIRPNERLYPTYATMK